MAGNTRGKLKEHFEGVHRNFEWCLHHINETLKLLDSKLRDRQLNETTKLSPEDLEKFIAEYPLCNGVKALGEGISKLDELAMDIYKSL